MKKILWIMLVLITVGCSRQVLSVVSYAQQGADCIKTEKSTIREKGRLTSDVQEIRTTYRDRLCAHVP